MENFIKIAAGVDVMPLMAAVQMRPHLWNQNALRTTHKGSAHTQADDIWLRFNDAKPGKSARVIDDLSCINYPALADLPQARPLVFGLAARMEAEQIGRCVIARLKPGCAIAPHADTGAAAEFYERFHIVLRGEPGVEFRAGQEAVQMRTGDIWWFQNLVEHEVKNYSHEDRVHLIVDLRITK